MGGIWKTTFGVVGGMALPILSQAQTGGLADDIHGLQGVLDTLYTTMLPQCSQLIGVGQAIAGFAALWFIAARVWPQIARAEPVDVYSLLRPFVISLLIMLFPSVIGVMNGVLQPVVEGTAAMETNANGSIAVLLQQKEEALKNTIPYQLYVGASGEGDEGLWEAYTGNSNNSLLNPLAPVTNAFAFQMAKTYYNFKNSIRTWMSEALQVVYEAAALAINTLRTFQLLVLAILGPLVLGLSVFDGFQYTLRAWLARYINVFLWLPVANIFGAIIANIQVNMVQLDISQIQSTGGTFFSSTDLGYLVFLIIGIIGYFTVPSVAGYIVNVGGAGPLTGKVTRMAGLMVQQTVQETGHGATNLVQAPGQILEGYRSADPQRSKISGKNES